MAQLEHLTQATMVQIKKFEANKVKNAKRPTHRSVESMPSEQTTDRDAPENNDEVRQINKKLNLAYKRLDRNKKKLLKVKKLVF